MRKKIEVATFFIAAVVLIAVFFWVRGQIYGGTVVTGIKGVIYEINGSPVKLRNGAAETEAAPGSASKITTKYFGDKAYGDINGDGMKDTAFLVTQSGGGSGTFYYAVAALKTTDGYVGTNAVLLGDRIAPQTTEIRNGTLIVNYADRKAGEPMTARPSVGVSKYLEVNKGVLAEAPVFLESPETDKAIGSPLTISGKAKGNWFFEANLPLVLLDGNGNIIAQGHATARGNWMTDGYVDFSGTLEFRKPATAKGSLVVKKDNPSGMPEKDDSRSFMVIF